MAFSPHILLFALLLFTITIGLSSAQTSDVRVRIINSPPKSTSSFSQYPIIDGDSSVVWCGAVFEDLNSFMDFKKFEASYHPTTSPSKVKSHDFLLAKQDSVVKGQVNAGFVIKGKVDGEHVCILKAQDSAGDSVSANSTFMVGSAECINQKKDPQESGIDCGGSCKPCSCTNSIIDNGEEGVDCGGPCMFCKIGELQMKVPAKVGEGEQVKITISAGSEGVKSLVRIEKPSKGIMVTESESDGTLDIIFDESGEWTIYSDLYGYSPTSAKVNVESSLTIYLLIGVAVLVIIAAAVIVYLKTKK